jgi:hypothetical protein
MRSGSWLACAVVLAATGACAKRPASPAPRATGAHGGSTSTRAPAPGSDVAKSPAPEPRRTRLPLPEPRLEGAAWIALDDEDAICVRKEDRGVVCAVPGRATDTVYPMAVAESEVEIALGPLGMCMRDTSGAVECLRPSQTGAHVSPGGALPRLASFERESTTHLVGMYAGYCAMRGGDVVCEDSEHRSYVLPDGLAIETVSLGRSSVCGATTSGGHLWCFELGVEGSLRPAERAEARGVVETVSGEYHTCMRFESGKVACFGDDSLGQLGAAKRVRPSTLVEVPLPRKALRLAAGQSHTCAIVEGGAVYCWGTAERGAATGVEKGGARLPKCRLLRVEKVARGARGAIDVPIYDDSVRCVQGEEEVRVQAQPVAIARIPKAKAIAAGRFRTCVVGDRGEVACWGGTPIRFREENGAIKTD